MLVVSCRSHGTSKALGPGRPGDMGDMSQRGRGVAHDGAETGEAWVLGRCAAVICNVVAAVRPASGVDAVVSAANKEPADRAQVKPVGLEIFRRYSPSQRARAVVIQVVTHAFVGGPAGSPHSISVAAAGNRAKAADSDPWLGNPASERVPVAATVRAVCAATLDGRMKR